MRAWKKTPGKEKGLVRRSPGKGLGLAMALGLILALAAGGCAFNRPDKSVAPPTHHDVAVRDEKAQGLKFEILDFSWHYLPVTDQIQVSGRAQNLTGESQQAVTLRVTAYDQSGHLISRTSTFLNPTYIKPDQIARFDFYLNGGESVTSVRLEYYFQIQH